MSKTERLINVAFSCYEAALAGHETIWLDENDVRAVKAETGVGLNSATEFLTDPNLPEPLRIPVIDREFGYTIEGEQVETNTYFELLLNDDCLDNVSDALRKRWRRDIGPRYPAKLYPRLAKLRDQFATRTTDEAIRYLKKVRQRWTNRLTTNGHTSTQPTSPTYGLVFDQRSRTVSLAWPNDKRRRRKVLPCQLDSQVFRVFTAVLQRCQSGIVRDVDLAHQLYVGGYCLTHKVRRNISRWVCEFNTLCRSVSKEQSRPLVRRKGVYEIMVTVVSI